MDRRQFLTWGAATAAVLGCSPSSWAAALRRANIKVAATDWNLALEGKIGAFALAKEAGLDGVQVSLGKNDEKKGEEHLPMMDPEKQKAFLEESKKTGIPIVGTCLEILHRDNLKAHANGPKWVEQSIAATKGAAMANVRGIAVDAASAIVERLVGTAPAAPTVAAAVDEALKR